MTNKEIIVKPLTTEKTTQMAEQNRFVLKVAIDARKPEIAAEVEKKYGVHVLAVRTIIVKGGSKYVRGTRRAIKLSPYKKAIVTLKAGERIEQV